MIVPDWGGFFYPADIESLAVTTGTVANIVNVFNTYPNQPVVINSSGGADTVNIGDASGVQGIRGDVQIQNDPNYTVININNTGDAVGRNIAIDQWAGNFGAIGGLAPAYITWDRNDVQTVNISTGQGQDSIGLLRTSERLTSSIRSGPTLDHRQQRRWHAVDHRNVTVSARSRAASSPI